MRDDSAEKEEAQLISFVIALGALVVTLLVGRALEKRHVHWLPHSGVGVLVGAFCAGVLRWESGFSRTRLDNDVLRDERFSSEAFMTLLLPPIIFDAGFNIDAPSAMRNLGPSLFFAFVGTTFSTVVVGLVCFGAGQLGICYPLGLLASLTFGSLISATDPVSVLSVFKACGVHDDIFAIVFGESVLNDAVAIVLTRTLLAFNGPASSGGGEASMGGRVVRAVALFVVEFASSLVIGAGFGFALALLLQKLEVRDDASSTEPPTKPARDGASSAPPPDDDAPLSDDSVLTVALVFAFPWASYYAAEALECSGIVTLLFCGMVMAQYAKPHMSPTAARVSSAAFKCAGFVAETGVFIYLGEAVRRAARHAPHAPPAADALAHLLGAMCAADGAPRACAPMRVSRAPQVFSFPILHNTTWRLTAVAMAACALGRLHVPLGVALTNAARGQQQRRRPLPNAELRADAPLTHLSHGVSLVLWWSGLRGGVAFALASASYGHDDFVQHCGGLSREQAPGAAASHAHGWMRHCSEGSRHSMTDGLALLQVTLLVATCSIFVLGGSIKRVAEACGVLKGADAASALGAVRPATLSRAASRNRLLASPS